MRLEASRAASRASVSPSVKLQINSSDLIVCGFGVGIGIQSPVCVGCTLHTEPYAGLPRQCGAVVGLMFGRWEVFYLCVCD